MENQTQRSERILAVTWALLSPSERFQLALKLYEEWGYKGGEAAWHAMYACRFDQVPEKEDRHSYLTRKRQD